MKLFRRIVFLESWFAAMKVRDKKSYNQFFLKALRKKWYLVLESILSGTIRALVMLLPTYFTKLALNSISTGLTNKLVWYCLGIVISPLIVLFLYVLDTYLSQYVFQIVQRIREKVVGSLVQSSVDLKANQADGLYTNLYIGTQNIEDYYYSSLSNLTWYAATLVWGFGFMFEISWQITLSVIVITAIQIFLTTLNGAKIKKITAEKQNATKRGLALVGELFNQQENIKVQTRYRSEEKKVNGWFGQYYKILKQNVLVDWLSDFYSKIAQLIRMGIIFVLGIILFEQQKLLPGDLVALNTYILWLIPVIYGLQNWLLSRSSIDVYKNDLNLLMNKKDIQHFKKLMTGEIKSIRGANITSINIEKSNVTPLDFCIKSPGTYFVTGSSGSGKTSLMEMIVGLNQNFSGTVKINGYDIQTIDRESLYKRIKMVDQRNEIIDASLYENLFLDVNRDSFLSVYSALVKKMQLNNVFEQYYYSERSISDVGLSDGEKKRICVLRGLASNVETLILDEPTAGLDYKNKKVVISLIDAIRQGKLTIIVTHDNIENYDNVIEV
ncbi:ATP-binding cassette domain-containing protein [Lactiplantibacillus pentosus]|uniref:ABC transporter ATP-binding protein/permease n=4 Tax=Lactiplantibacillus pentosus TaxID=1589 RepID=A0AAX6LFS4_LACPE|nr:ABC transporter ATP-binding protein [Lactiplantibacillus pentosus]AYJ40851.1 ABC transporter ATP-binding protein [Lactiplantibacillus pentosus]MCC3161995.1 ABC transporter ATP-binding protein/permease [Lactiplantibacillus pentosus]MCJ8189168.1 ABC transporter ATP-binding protein/permease [Lactiplantibacillus pentosus]MCT3297307.1 ABC transporter ATP-binding protein [Lactiplantibacillus pentosus]MCT3300684.1 ABC transporter ATP-binding protein [Lactiplantibacillus pentosus]